MGKKSWILSLNLILWPKIFFQKFWSALHSAMGHYCKILGPLQKLLFPIIFCCSDKNSKVALYYKNILSKHNCQRNLDGKNYYCPKNLDWKNYYHPRILTTIQKVGKSRISFSLFLLIRFWILVRNGFCQYCPTLTKSRILIYLVKL